MSEHDKSFPDDAQPEQPMDEAAQQADEAAWQPENSPEAGLPTELSVESSVESPAESSYELSEEPSNEAPVNQPESGFSDDDFVRPDEAYEPDAMPDPAFVQPSRTFDDLTLAEALAQFLRKPAYTWASLWHVARDEGRIAAASPRMSQAAAASAPAEEVGENIMSVPLNRPQVSIGASVSDLLSRAGVWQLMLYLLAFVLGIYGSAILISAPMRSETGALAQGAPYLWLAFGIWLLTDVLRYRRAVMTWWLQRDTPQRWHLFLRVFPSALMLFGLYLLIDSMSQPREVVLIYVAPGVQLFVAGLTLWFFLDLALLAVSFYIPARSEPVSDAWAAFFAQRRQLWVQDETPPAETEQMTLPWYMRIHPMRIFLVLGGCVLSLLTWWGTAGNTIPDPVIVLWLLSVTCWSLAFVPHNWRPLVWAQGWLRRLRGFSWSAHRWTILALFLLIFLAAAFRLTELDRLPPEMTSDHVEKILDAQRVSNGQRTIFFANNGGREPFQMYALALFSQLPGQGINFDSLKLLAVLESLLTLPVLYWMTREILRPVDRRTAALTALLVVALVAVSYWHTAVTRLALRIILTPLVASLLLIYLTRALRGNHRADYIKAGLILGFGLYMYQAVRMLPVIIVIGVVAALYFSARSIQDRVRYIANLSVLVLISLVIFLPMLHYSIDNPEEFWRRTTGRLLGDEIIETRLPDGTISLRDATVGERIEAFNENVPTLMSNIRAVLLMFNWKGDVAWINGFPNYPALDIFTGTLFILGWAAWFMLALRRRDIVLWLLPLFLFVLLLPSALSIAFPVENPSHTRTSGAIPIVYLIAAYPLALLVVRMTRIWPSWRGNLSALGLCSVVILGANLANTRVYFEDFRESYLVSSLPYSDPGRVLQGFAISDGAYGNAFMIAYPFWWDHRAIGMEAGRNDWPNGIVSLGDVPRFLRDSLANAGSRYQLDPTRDLLFFYNVADDQTAQQLSEWFPAGRAIRYPSYQAGDDFMVFRVPALGGEGFLDFLAQSELNGQ